MDRALGKGKGNNNKRGGNNKTVKAKGGASSASNNANPPRKLSDRFDRIVHTAPAAKGNRNIQNQNQKGGKKTVVVVQKKGSNPKTTPKGAKGKGKGNAPATAGNGKKDNKKKDAGKKGKAAPKVEKEKPKSADDLDLEMATYWHKAGKGPDPKLAKLDADMDDYFAKKEDDGAEVVTTETVAETVTEAVVEVPETETTTE